ncbi:MAG TPA: SAM-dependent chlorinase/fluorinase, partial [Actinomycetota bacterium]|nr:SAM-dependent chlorinase/fluorinase [Actinomycetota bacterium]
MIRNIAGEVVIADVSHLIRPYGVREGATVLAETVGYIPDAVHLAVVDPGVGSARRGVILAAAGSLLVGPDNGLLVPAAERLGGIESVWEITNRRLGLAARSSTFHGRDVFAPAAAHLAIGTSPSDFGPRVPAGSLVE